MLYFEPVLAARRPGYGFIGIPDAGCVRWALFLWPVLATIGPVAVRGVVRSCRRLWKGQCRCSNHALV